MVYDLQNPLHKSKFKTRCNHLYKKEKVVELQEVWLGYSVQIEKTYRKFVNIVGTVIDRFGVVLDDAMEVAKEVDA